MFLVLSRLLYVYGLFAFLVQWVAFIPAFIYQTEKYFDLLGSLTYVFLALVAFLLSSQEPGSVLIALMVVLWAIRLGSFLFLRVRRAGEDGRFRLIKPDLLQFLMTWTLQGLWVFVTFAAGLAALTSSEPHPISAWVIIGVSMWVIGFGIEVLADHQKSTFKKEPHNAEKFIQHGLWAWSRHPNYLGEILLWCGVAVVAFPVLGSWQYLTLVSPLFVLLLLTKISGVRMLEARGKRKWGQDEAYLAYCERTPMLLLNPFISTNES